MPPVSPEPEALGASARPPPGVTFSLNAVGASWSLAVREHQALPPWVNALVQGSSMAALISLFDHIRGRVDWVKVLGWGAGWALSGFLTAKWRARRFRTVLSGNDLEMMIDHESIALSEIVACSLRAEPGRRAHWSVMLECRTIPEIVLLNRLTREQADFCFEVLSSRVQSSHTQHESRALRKPA